MNGGRFRERLLDRASAARVAIPNGAVDRLEAYFVLLGRWNKRINLTSLPLDNPTDQALDRLLIEPLIAADYVEDSPLVWFDLGSGGGSPGIPIKILRPRALLTMVEARSRKAAFLREVARELRLEDVTVIADRFETVAAHPASKSSADLITARAVRLDVAFFESARRLAKHEGRLMVFVGKEGGVAAPKFRLERTVGLSASGDSELLILTAE